MYDRYFLTKKNDRYLSRHFSCPASLVPRLDQPMSRIVPAPDPRPVHAQGEYRSLNPNNQHKSIQLR